MKQCGRLYLPQIEMKPSLKKWQELPFPILFGDTRPQASPLELPLSKPCILLIGPEPGLSEDETLVLETKLHAKGVKLHHNTLRTETAAIAFLSLACYQGT